MQKITAIILSIVLVFSISGTTFALEMPKDNSTSSVVDTGFKTPEDEEFLPETEINTGEVPVPDEEITPDEETLSGGEISPGEESPSDEETSSDEETLPEEEGSTQEQPPIEEIICTCDPVIVGEDGIHSGSNCPFYTEVIPEILMPLMLEDENNLWSDKGNYNADWLGITDYANTTEFTIESAADLAAFIIVINKDNANTFEGKTVTLEADIDLSDHLWDMRGAISRTGGNGNFFSGTFDGNNHTITGMTINYENEYVGDGSDFGNFGLFADLNNATVYDLTISNSRLIIGYVAPSFPTGIGVLCGSISSSTIENVSVVNATITQKENKQGSTGFYFGGIAGIEFSPYTRAISNEPNTYINCTVDGLSITYSQVVDDEWTLLMGFGGMIGGVFPMGADPQYQSTISDCNIRNLTLKRNLAAESFTFECYGGLIGFSPYPVTIDNTHVSDLLIDFELPTGNGGSDILGPPFATAMLGGLIGYAQRDVNGFPAGTSAITNSSVNNSKIVADNLENLLPVYVGGLIGLNDGVTTTDCYTQIDLTGVKDKKAVKYGNLFGLLQTSAEQRVTISNNIFNNYDYIATDKEINEPSKDYIGRKLSTLALAGELSNTANIGLSQNWGILKNVLIVREKAAPLEYIQCSENIEDMDFYDYWTVKEYTHTNLTQDTDTAQVTFKRDSGKELFSMDAEIAAKSGKPTWNFRKKIIVLPNPNIPTYTVTYQPGDHGDFQPQEYSDLYAGEETPKFIGTPAGKEDWSFEGWKPEVAATVTADAVYTAQWKNTNAPDPGDPSPGNPDPTGHGDLIITKTVTGNSGDKKRDFTFEVIFSASGSYNYTGSKSGTITSGDTVTLKHGQEVTIQNIPVGATYTVRELEANKDGYTTEVKGDTGTITTDKKTASFTNHKTSDVPPGTTGDLTISKTVTGNAGDKKKEFTFKVTFDDGGTYSYTGSKSGTITSGDTVKLGHGQSITIENIPVGVTYTVNELEANKGGYTTVVKGGKGTITTAGKKAKFTNDKTISANEKTTSANDKTTPVGPDNTGDLIIKKIVTGKAGNKDKAFTFMVTFDADGAYRYIGDKSGMITSGDTISLKNGQSITILDLPAGKTYTVTELEANQGGYETTVTGGSGKILADEAVTAEFINDKSTQGKSSTAPNSPQTGDDFDLFMWIGFLVLSGTGCIWGFIFKYRKTDQHKS